MPVITNIEDLRQIARRRIPRAIYDYVERGSYDERTLASNRDDLNAIRLRQRVLIDVSEVSLGSTMLGEKVSMPIALAPTGLMGLVHGDGEMFAARAAEAAGTKFCQSTMSICTIEDVRSVVTQPFWFQLYVFRDRGFSESIIARARAVSRGGTVSPFLRSAWRWPRIGRSTVTNSAEQLAARARAMIDSLKPRSRNT